jgi:hypothetical protein
LVLTTDLPPLEVVVLIRKKRSSSFGRRFIIIDVWCAMHLSAVQIWFYRTEGASELDPKCQEIICNCA